MGKRKINPFVTALLGLALVIGCGTGCSSSNKGAPTAAVTVTAADPAPTTTTAQHTQPAPAVTTHHAAPKATAHCSPSVEINYVTTTQRQGESYSVVTLTAKCLPADTGIYGLERSTGDETYYMGSTDPVAVGNGTQLWDDDKVGNPGLADKTTFTVIVGTPQCAKDLVGSAYGTDGLFAVDSIPHSCTHSASRTVATPNKP